jgi:hypothetical protein
MNCFASRQELGFDIFHCFYKNLATHYILVRHFIFTIIIELLSTIKMMNLTEKKGHKTT